MNKRNRPISTLFLAFAVIAIVISFLWQYVPSSIGVWFHIVPGVLLIGVIPTCVFFYLKFRNTPYKKEKNIMSYVIIGCMLSFGFYVKYLDELTFQGNGEYVNGFVGEQKFDDGDRRIRCVFIVKGVIYYTDWKIDNEYNLEVGDSTKILYSEINPDINVIYELENFIFY